jgi:hypothetical protein
MLQAGRSWDCNPDITGFFNCDRLPHMPSWRSAYLVKRRDKPNSSSHTMALGSTQPLTGMSTRNFPGGVKSGRHIRLTALLPSMSWLSRWCGSFDLSHPCGLLWPVTGTALSFFFCLTRESIVMMKNTGIQILMDLHILSLLEHEKVVFGTSSLYVHTYTWMCTLLAPEQLDRF